MSEAKATVTPDQFLEASLLFEKAREYSIDEKARLLMMGHSSFCRALNAGTRFEASRERNLHHETIQHLASASNYYAKAGYESALESVRGTQRLFDAYVFMDTADLETDPRKRARFYTMAERVLEASGDSFLKAGQKDKGNEVKRLLGRVRDERKFAVSLSEVLSSPNISLSTTSFDSPSPSMEKAVGIERFDDAEIQVNLSLEIDDLTVGEDTVFELEIINTGKLPALLQNIHGMVLSDFKVSEKTGSYINKEGILGLEGRKLEPLETEVVTFLLNPHSKGMYKLWPKIEYINEAGEQILHKTTSLLVKVESALMKGRCYLFTSHKRCLKSFMAFTQRGEPSLAIIRDDPTTLISGQVKKEDVILLFSRSIRGYEAMTDIQEISRKISQRLVQGVKIVLLDGLEYLISRFGFDTVFNFIQEKRLNMLEAEAIMLVPFDLVTINDRQKAQLKSEMEIR
jgi:hypothetical protein